MIENWLVLRCFRQKINTLYHEPTSLLKTVFQNEVVRWDRNKI